MLGELSRNMLGMPPPTHTQSLADHWEYFSFHTDGNGEPWNGFEQKRD